MNRFLCLIGLVLAVLHGAHSQVEFTNEVICSAQGFKPSFSYDDDLDTTAQILSVTLLLGATDVSETGEGAAPAWCQGSNPTNGDPTSQSAAITVDSDTLDSTLYADSGNGGIGAKYIPFQQANADGAPGTDGPRCGGVLQHFTDTDDNVDKIKYEVNAKVIIKRKFRNTIIRTTQYPFVIRCALTREHTTLSTTQGFTVTTALVDETWSTATDGQVRSTITYVATLTLFTENTYTTEAANTIEVDNDKQVYIQVEQGDNQELFKFHVDQCFSTVDSAATPAGGATHKDIFWDGGCPADSTVTAAADSTEPATKFNIALDSFYFPGETSTAVHFHCKLTICLASSNDPECVAATDCSTNHAINENNAIKRRRRSTEESGVIGSKMISSSQSVLINQAQVFAPSCGNGFIYDRVLGECSNENLVEINGIYLGAAAWDPAYANITSDAFKSMAAAREYQLWVLLQVTRRSEYIRGVKIIRARQGSVILDVIIKHAASVSAEEAFHQMEKALKTEPSTTRVMNLLQIREEKTIELVPVVVAGEKSDTEKLILIVVVVVLFVVVFIAGVTLFKVRQTRQQSSSTTTSFDNKGVDA